MMSLLHSEAVLACVASIVGALWTLLKSHEWMRGMRQRKVNDALEALEAAVDATYREYVRALKEQDPSGRLSAGEQEEARKQARDRAVDIARRRGVDLVETLGNDFIDLWTGRIVKKLKQA
ncbi:MAG: hypothetical protein GX117_04070 [Candidatus Hydrogenedentes bacterium]|jgi:hypothetical protein|nr:hypothetical protein [Candidatus Hydrogenedentota bacterium]